MQPIRLGAIKYMHENLGEKNRERFFNQGFKLVWFRPRRPVKRSIYQGFLFS